MMVHDRQDLQCGLQGFGMGHPHGLQLPGMYTATPLAHQGQYLFAGHPSSDTPTSQNISTRDVTSAGASAGANQGFAPPESLRNSAPKGHVAAAPQASVPIHQFTCMHIL